MRGRSQNVSALSLFPARKGDILMQATHRFGRTTWEGHELLLHITLSLPELSPVPVPSFSSIRQIIDGQKWERNVITRNEKVEGGPQKGLLPQAGD